MPRITLYDRNQQVKPLQGGEIGARYTEASFGGNAAAAANKIAGNLYQAEIDRQNQVAFLEADRRMSEWENAALYDPKNGALNVRGKDAFGLPDTVTKAFEDQVSEVNKGLSTQTQRDAFNRSIVARRRDLGSTLSRHVFTETRRFEEAETTSYIANARNAAILNSSDPQRVSTEMARIRASVADLSRRNGYGPEYEKQRLAKEVSDTHVGIVERFLQNRNDLDAQRYFEASKSEIEASAMSVLEGKLKVAGTEAQGLRTATEIWDKLGPRNDIDAVNVDKMHEAARTMHRDNPVLLKATTQAIDERYNKHNAAQREREEQNSSTVWAAIEKGATLADVRGMPSFLALPGKMREDIKQHIVSNADAVKRRADNQGDDELFYNLMTEASSPATQAKFAQTNLMQHRPKLSYSQFTSLISVQTALRKGDDKQADKLLASETVQRQIVNDAMLQMGLDPTPKEGKTSMVESVTTFRRAVRDAVRQHESRTQKPITDEEMQGLVDRLVIKGKVPGSGVLWDDTKRTYQLKPGEAFAIKYADVPPRERKKIEDALRRNGRAVTNEAVTTIYTRKLLESNAAQ